MECKILLPYIDYHSSNFEVDDDFYVNGGYEQALKKNNEMYGDSIYNHISNGGFNANTTVFRNPYSFNDNNYDLNNKVSKNEEKTLYSSCECFIYNEFMKDISINDLMEQMFSKDVSVMFIKLNFDTAEEEFEEDFKLWVQTHNNINKQNMSDEWKFENEPKKNIRLVTLNKEFDFINCKILEMSSEGFFILIEEIKEIK